MGPFRALAFKIPTTQSKDMYIRSINKTVDDYGALLREQKAGHLTIADLDFDTGRETRAGEYSLADKTYAHLLDDLAKHNFAQASPELRQNILSFYADGNASIATKKNAKAWRITQGELDKTESEQRGSFRRDTASTLAPTHKLLK